jgi:hypothetical protein
VKSPREIFEALYKDAAAEGAIIELHMRLLADKMPTLRKFAHDQRLEDVETLIVQQFAAVLSDDEKRTLELCRQLRNKILHCNFKAARKKLQQIGAEPSRGDVKKVNISGLSGKEMLEKLTSPAGNVAGSFEHVADLPAGPGSVYGWLIEIGQAGDFVQAVDAFKRGAAIVDRLAES